VAEADGGPDATVESSSDPGSPHEGPAPIIRSALRRAAGDCRGASRGCDTKQGGAGARWWPDAAADVAREAPAWRSWWPGPEAVQPGSAPRWNCAPVVVCRRREGRAGQSEVSRRL